MCNRCIGCNDQITIGNDELAYDFMDNDGDFRSWLVGYLAENTDSRSGTHIGLIVLRFWRGEDKHGDQLLSTHLEQKVSPDISVLRSHQRFLLASIRNDKPLVKTTWKEFSATRKWITNLDYPQMLRTHEDLFVTEFPRLP